MEDKLERVMLGQRGAWQQEMKRGSGYKEEKGEWFEGIVKVKSGGGSIE